MRTNFCGGQRHTSDVQKRTVEDHAGELAGTALSRNKKRSAPIKTMFSSDVLISPLEHGRHFDEKIN